MSGPASRESGALVLLGENNAGKSNVTRALDILFGDTWPGSRRLEDHDFHGSGYRPGVGNYEITGLLCDADLFRRLRTRGQARGAEGIDDLVAALRLVAGTPFDQLRSGGYGWLAETATDHHLIAGIDDVAHVVATAALASGDPQRAAWAAAQAIRAAPYEDKPRLDLARAQRTMGHVEGAHAYVAAQVFNRSDDDQAPPDPSARVEEVAGRLVGRRRSQD